MSKGWLRSVASQVEVIKKNRCSLDTRVHQEIKKKMRLVFSLVLSKS